MTMLRPRGKCFEYINSYISLLICKLKANNNLECIMAGALVFGGRTRLK